MAPKKMQEVKFRTVGEFMDFLPPSDLEIVEYLRDIILDCIPECQEKLSYNVPYYKRFANICFLWPGSVIWGSRQTYEGVRLGFTKGFLLSDEAGYLEKGNRKQVFWRDFTSIEEINEEMVRALLYEAVELDEVSYLEKKRQS